MSKLDIKAKVMYMPGPWGINEPIKGAKVKIIDLDIGGRDDVIFSKNTSSLGKVAGLSTEWQDKRKLRIWQPLPLPGKWVTKTVPDISDIMLLEIDVREGEKHIRAPFVYLGKGVEVPIIVPWGKESFDDAIVGAIGSLLPTISINGTPYSDAMDAQKAVRKRFEAKEKQVDIVLTGPEALLFMPFAGKNINALKNLVDEVLPGTQQFFYSNPIGAAELSAIAIIILASGAAVSGTLFAGFVGFSLILALFLGYTNIGLDVAPGSGNNPLPSIKFSLKLPD